MIAICLASFAVKVNWKFGAVTPCMASPLPLSFPSGARTFGRRARAPCLRELEPTISEFWKVPRGLVWLLQGACAAPARRLRTADPFRDLHPQPASGRASSEMRRTGLACQSLSATAPTAAQLFQLRVPMIRLDNISKQIGHQILFIEASATLERGEKVGLVGPNGAGKTTLFRMITGQEQPDEGQVAVDRGVTIGYFSQDVGEMSGRSAVAEVMDGAGPVSTVAAELKELEHAMADPDRADEMESIIERYGEVQHRFEELDGYALEGRAREVLSGLSFSQEMMEGDVGGLSGGWKMRVALARILLMRPDVMLLDEPSNHLDLESLIWLEQFLKGYEGT